MPGQEPTSFCLPPASACWRHLGARVGFEVAYFKALRQGCQIDGTTTAIEEGNTWIVTYTIQLDAGWTTRAAQVTTRTADGVRETRLECDGAGTWLVAGKPAPQLQGCLDVDLESSALTNAFPVHRLRLAGNGRAEVAAAYVRLFGATVERLEQTYARTSDEARSQTYAYAAPAFDFAGRLTYDEAGLLLDYPGIAVRVA